MRQVKIVSGGQTGVDRGALDAALALGIACGGWCPAGRRAEDGPIAIAYPLRETASEHYHVRTRRNVIDSDATLVIHFGDLEGGTARTVDLCQELNKPCCCIDALRYSPEQAVDIIDAFIQEYRIHTLNVAGPRASKQVQASHYTRTTITLFLASRCQQDQHA